METVVRVRGSGSRLHKTLTRCLYNDRASRMGLLQAPVKVRFSLIDLRCARHRRFGCGDSKPIFVQWEREPECRFAVAFAVNHLPIVVLCASLNCGGNRCPTLPKEWLASSSCVRRPWLPSWSPRSLRHVLRLRLRRHHHRHRCRWLPRRRRRRFRLSAANLRGGKARGSIIDLMT